MFWVPCYLIITNPKHAMYTKICSICRQYKLHLIFITLLFLGFTLSSCEEEPSNEAFQAILSIATEDASVTEGTDNSVVVSFSLDKENMSGQAIPVKYSVSGTAEAGSDYQSLSGSTEIPSGSNSVDIQINIIDDNEIESDETIVVSLDISNLPEGITVTGSTSATVTIADNDRRTISVQASDASALEGDNDGEFTISIDQALSSAVTVDYTMAGSATNGEDYGLLSGSVEIVAGSTSATVTVDVTDDANVENDETAVLRLSTTQEPGIIVGSQFEATVTISDNDVMEFSAVVSISASDPTAMEGDNDGEFTVNLSQTNTTGAAISIAYSISGTATGGTDYATLNGSVEIANNNSSATILVDVINDNEVESDETVIITLDNSQPAGITLGSSTSATVTISDNDEATSGYEISVTTQNSSVSESDAGTAFKVVLDKTNESGSDVTVSYDLSGSAAAGADYTAPSGSVTVVNGAVEALVEIPLIDDSDDEGDETIIVTLSNTGLPNDFALSSSSSITITITDDDATSTCPNDNSTDQNNWDCDESPVVANSYNESISGDVRTIVTNGVPEHDYRNQIKNIVSSINTSTKTYLVDVTPSLAGSTTDLTNSGTPQWKFGVAKNGVPIDPAPAEPFIFENTTTGEYNWNWMMEPNYNMEAVGLDCSVSHFQPDGQLHYHGNMALFADQLLSGLGAGTTTPSEPVRIGWAADGFPIVYEYGPNATGVFSKLESSYRIKSGDRSGDGVSEPCGEYNGKYTNDFEYVGGLGDLDECNGIEQSITVDGETFSYFYVITDSFPYIPRCISGTPDDSFKIGM